MIVQPNLAPVAKFRDQVEFPLKDFNYDQSMGFYSMDW